MRALLPLFAMAAALLMAENVALAQGDPPVVTLLGANPQLILEGGVYVELDATALDTEDGDLTLAIVITGVGAIDTDVPGDYIVTYTVTDSNSNVVAEDRTVTVVNVNDAPVFTNAGATTATEGVLYTYTMTASDEEGNPLTFAAPTLPGWLSFTAPATISGTPQQGDVGGPYNVSVTVSDDIAPAVQQNFSITVSNVNDPPTFTNAGPTAATEGVLYSYTMTATDDDGNPLTFAAPTLPGWLSFTAPATISGTPQQGDVGGPHSVTVTVSDGIAPAVQQNFSITVSNVNDPPTFTNAGPTTATEGVLYSYTMTGTDDDGNPLTFAAPTLPAWLSFNGTNTISGTPQQAQVGGPHNVTVTVSDGIAAPVQQSFAITVSDVNDPPVFTNAGPTTATEGVLYTYTMTATDNDGNPLTFAAPTLPAWLSFTAPATISGTPQQAHVGGPHNVTVTVTDSIAPAVQQNFSITVTNVNDAPTFTNAGSTTATEGVLYSYTMTATDEDGNPLTFAAPTLPAWLSFTAPATISGTPQQGDVGGPHNVSVTVSDGIAPAVQQNFSITVTNVNDPPVFTNAGPTAATEGVLYTYTMTATDDDGNPLTFAAPTLPAWLSFTAPATISGTPQQAQVGGPHNVTVTVSDGIAPAVQQSFAITVSNVNDPPTFTNAGPTTATEGVLYTYTMTATDADGNPLTFSAPTLPAWLSFTAPATISGTPQQAHVGGPHNVTVTVTDGLAPAVQQSFAITVGNVDNPPTVVAPIPDQNGAEGTPFGPLSVAANFTDADGDAITFSASGLTPGRGLAISAAGVISGTPTNAAAQASPFNVTVTATTSDGSVNDTFVFTVADTANPPTVVTPIPDQTATEDAPFGPLSVAANFTDPDGDALTFSATGFPTGSGLAINATGVISGTPTNDAALASPFNVTVTATAGDGSVNDTFQFTVTNVNDDPTAVADSYTTAEDTTLTVAAPGVLGNDTDPDLDTLTAVLDTDVSNGTLTLNTTDGSFTYVPDADFEGADSFTYHANDGTASSNVVTVSITVTADNDAPVAVADSYNVAEDTALTVDVPGVLGNDTDPETGTTLTAVLDATTPNGTLTLNTNGSFSYAPNANFNGVDSFTYHAHDGSLAGNVATVTINVAGVNDPPVVTSSPQLTVPEDTSYSYTITATDGDGDPLMFAAPMLPSWLVFTAPATISGLPTEQEIGAHSVTMTVSDGLGPAVSQTFQITVDSVDDPPVITLPIADQTATELVAFSLDLRDFVTDVDTPASGLAFAATTSLPAGLSLSPAGVLSGTPALTTSVGDFTVGFTVNDGPNVTPPATFHLTVLRAGRADLAVNVAAAPNPVQLNTAATWTFTITNNAPQVAVGGVSLQVVFTGEVPFQFATPTNGCTISPAANQTQASCTLGALAGGATMAVTLGGTGNFAGDVFATATVAVIGSVPVDETPRNDTASGSLSIAQNVSTAPAQGITGVDARAAAAGDLDGDGFVDLAVATGSSQGTMVLLSVVDPVNPNKRTLSDTPIALGGQALGNGIALADLDGDLDLDVITATGAGAENRIFLNSGAATFTALTVGDASEDSRAVAAGDINGDLLPDLVFANGSPNTVYTNQGSGGVFAQTGALGDADSRGVVLVDLFGDALPELVFANADSDAAVYRNTAGVFQLELALPTGPTTSVATADFNSDGRMDLVFGRSGGATPAVIPSNLVWLNTSTTTGSFFLADELGASATTGVAVADFDLDGDIDILTINAAGSHQKYLNISGVSGTFALGAQVISVQGALTAAVGKLSVDDRVDAALVGPDGVAVFYNDGAGNLGSGDITAPTIQLVGQATVTLTVGDAYTDAGATATDTVDGNITSRIVVVNPVDAAVIGTYTVTYDVTDQSGNAAARVTRTVQVQTHQATGGGGGGATGFEFALLLAFAAVLGRLRPRWRRRGNAS